MASSSFNRDANYIPITSEGLIAVKTMTFAGGTTNDPGDYDGTGNPATLFTITGDVLVKVFGVCTVNLAGANATVEVGVTSGTALLLPLTTATDIDAGKTWTDTAPALTEVVTGQFILPAGQDIIQTVATANITSGTIKYYCLWTPLSSDGDVVAA